MIELVVLAVLLLLVALLLIIFRQTKNPRPRGKRRFGDRKSEKPTRPCPLCGSPLKRGERVRTVVLPGKADTLAEVYGCKYCYGETATAQRICPVCQKTVPRDGFVIGRMFKEGRHLHVVGCTECRKRGRPRSHPPKSPQA